MSKASTSDVNYEEIDKLPQLGFSTAEAGVMLGKISEARVRRLIRSGKLRARNTGGERGNQGSYIISKAAILEFLAGSDEPLQSAS
ncbi:helix-turn-helix domain-containing protein [Amycolatopsis sp. NPDC004368]